jgi:hypothetical protein
MAGWRASMVAQSRARPQIMSATARVMTTTAVI